MKLDSRVDPMAMAGAAGSSTEATASGVTWSAVFAGAITALSATLILLAVARASGWRRHRRSPQAGHLGAGLRSHVDGAAVG